MVFQTVCLVSPYKAQYRSSLVKDKRLVTQNIDGLDSKAGNFAYVPIHGRLDKVTVLYEQGPDVPLIDAPWEEIAAACDNLDDSARLTPILLDAFKISKKTLTP